ncbi:hypothetical protein VTP01DRAFT_10359 [Rhizomucor pusillus]|uniref:uncharacterized protein n=1 Tax=Rhizomucor pusillus TaxID=4840 RepID=UPI003743E13F
MRQGPLTFLFAPFFILAFLLLQRVCADDISLLEPRNHSTHYAGSDLTIHYKVNFNGMASLGSAAVSLADSRTGNIIQVFAEAIWLRSNGNRQVNFTWHIPRDFPSSTYILRVVGPASYPCSRHNDGRPPYGRCTTIIENSVSFDIRSNNSYK